MNVVLFFISKLAPLDGCRIRVQGMSRYARKRDWNIQTVECAVPGFSLQETLAVWRPVGAIIGTGPGTEGLRASAMNGIPVVYFDERPGRKGKGFYFGFDTEAVGRVAAQEFLRLGLQSCAYVASPLGECWCRLREKAFCAEVGPKRWKGAFAAHPDESALGRRRRLSAWLKGLPRPCGILAANDLTAQELLAQARLEGLSVPDDLVVLGVDDDATICENQLPTLSSISTNAEAASYRAMEILGEIVDGRMVREGRETFPPGAVVQRESTRRMPDADARIPRALEFIRREASAGIGVDEIVAQMGLKHRQAEILFRQTVGHSMSEELSARRVELAKQELANPYRQIQAIAGLCGWENDSSLRRAFRKATGLSLREWRRQNGFGG